MVQEWKNAILSILGTLSLWAGIVITVLGAGWIYHRAAWSSSTLFRPYAAVTLGVILIVAGIIYMRKK